FEQRNRLFDEALEVLRGVWAQDDFSYEGSGFAALGVTANPKPRRVPIWIGGDSALTRRRGAGPGEGGNPVSAPPLLAKTARTVTLEGLDDLAPMLDHLWKEVDAAGRQPSEIDIVFATGLPGPADPGFDAAAHLEVLERMAGMGVTWTGTSLPGDAVEHAVEAIERYGTEV